MKSIPSLLLSSVAAVALVATPCLRAQESTTTTTTTTTIPNPDDPAVSTNRTTVTTTTADPKPLPGQHVAQIELIVSEGKCQAYFGTAPRGEKIGIGDAEINIKLPSTATVTKLASRDGDSKDEGGYKYVTAEHPWRVTVPFDGPGRFVFNISDWDDAIVASCVVSVDGQVIFSGHGRKDEFKDWAQVTYGEGVRRTGDREIAFIVAGPRN